MVMSILGVRDLVKAMGQIVKMEVEDGCAALRDRRDEEWQATLRGREVWVVAWTADSGSASGSDVFATRASAERRFGHLNMDVSVVVWIRRAVIE